MTALLGAFLGFGFFFGLTYLSDKYSKVKNFLRPMWEIFSVGTLMVMFIVLGAVCSMFISIPYTYSDGDRVGTITKLTKKGLIFKTWEGQLNLGGVVSNGEGGITANVWDFSVTDPKIIEQLKNAKGTIKLTYDQHLAVPIYQGSTSYIITGVHNEN